MSVARAQAEIDSREFGQWLALSTLEPLGDERLDWQAALVASAAFNAGVKPETPTMPEDFLLKFQGPPEEKEPTWQELKEKAMRLAGKK